jgi:hypothetical protein
MAPSHYNPSCIMFIAEFGKSLLNISAFSASKLVDQAARAELARLMLAASISGGRSRYRNLRCIAAGHCARRTFSDRQMRRGGVESDELHLTRLRLTKAVLFASVIHHISNCSKFNKRIYLYHAMAAVVLICHCKALEDSCSAHVY